jgi:hypothetical protein
MVKEHGTSITQRLYPTVNTAGTTKWVTRDIAALDFLLGIPMAQQGELVRRGWEQRQGRQDNGGGGGESNMTAGKWWEQLVVAAPSSTNGADGTTPSNRDDAAVVVLLEGPQRGGGRRLDGDAAVKVQIPLAADSKSTRQRSIARQAQIREWELQVTQQQQILGGRVFFSAKDNYPVSVFSVIRYEPKREEAARRRKKLEERGGGGSQFVVPERDWRGTSYRALLHQPRHADEEATNKKEKRSKAFNRFLTPGKADDSNNNTDYEDDDDDYSVSSDGSSEEEDTYVPGFLDDPEMRQGRHRHVMIGDRVSGCIVSSTIQFVKPAELKADLNKQFRERFDRWEPPKSQHKYIGAKVNDGVYTLIDPTEESEEEENIRMPPSLTLSKIRSLKQQALLAAVDAHLEVSTMALAVVYFERLCLDCRVDKSNRRLAFAACMLLAAKINEANVVGLVMQPEDNEKKGLQSLIRPTQKSSTIFASLLEFFTHDWSLSLKHLFSAEWGVFAALGFRLHATPSQVEFHFRRLMKVLGWNGLAYLGPEMYTQWQDCLEAEERRQQERETRREVHREYKERKLLKLELRRQKEEKEWHKNDNEQQRKEADDSAGGESHKQPKHQTAAMKLLNRFTSLARPASMERISLNDRLAFSTHEPMMRRKSMKKSPSMTQMSDKAQSAPGTPPSMQQQHIAIDINATKQEEESERSDENSVGVADATIPPNDEEVGLIL